MKLLLISVLIVALFISIHSLAISSEQCREVCGGIEDFQCIRNCMSNKQYIQRKFAVQNLRPMRQASIQQDSIELKTIEKSDPKPQPMHVDPYRRNNKNRWEMFHDKMRLNGKKNKKWNKTFVKHNL
jgi:hypothetical protein